MSGETTANLTACYSCTQPAAWNARLCPNCGVLWPGRRDPRMCRRSRWTLGIILGIPTALILGIALLANI
jgi:hypothetical protein